MRLGRSRCLVVLSVDIKVVPVEAPNNSPQVLQHVTCRHPLRAVQEFSRQLQFLCGLVILRSYASVCHLQSSLPGPAIFLTAPVSPAA